VKSLTKLWVDPNAFVTVAYSHTELGQLCVAGGSVAVELRIVRVTLDRLGVMLKGVGVVT